MDGQLPLISVNRAAQWGIVVRDIDEGIRMWSELLGVGPFMHIAHIAPYEHDAIYHGTPSDVRITVAFCYFGETQIELVQQLNDSPSPYVDFLAKGTAGIQHIGFWTERYDESYAGLVARGYQPVYRARMRGVERETVYFQDSGNAFGPMLELSLSTPRKTALFGAMADRVKKWDGGNIVERYESMDELASTLGMASWTTPA